MTGWEKARREIQETEAKAKAIPADISTLAREMVNAKEIGPNVANVAQAYLDAVAVIAKHDLCHDLHGKVGQGEFEEGCRRETVKEFGSCKWSDRIAELEAALRKEREAWNDFLGIKRPDGSPPLSPRDVKLMRAIFADPEDEEVTA